MAKLLPPGRTAEKTIGVQPRGDNIEGLEHGGRRRWGCPGIDAYLDIGRIDMRMALAVFAGNTLTVGRTGLVFVVTVIAIVVVFEAEIEAPVRRAIAGTDDVRLANHAFQAHGIRSLGHEEI
jgi:hypothetical protein